MNKTPIAIWATICLMVLIAYESYLWQERWLNSRPGLHIHINRLELLEHKEFNFDCDTATESMKDAALEAAKNTVK